MNYLFDNFLRWIFRAIKNIIGEKNTWKFYRLLTNISILAKLFFFNYRNIFSHVECYITCTGKRDGAGAQALAVMSTMLFAEVYHIKYVHTPFFKLQHNYENDIEWEKKWEDFFNLGMGELKIGDKDVQISQEISLGENPLKLKKQSNTLFVLRHCHDYADIFPNQYSRIKNKLLEKYYGSSKSEYELNYNPKKVNVAIHIRRGDVNGTNQFREKFTENTVIFKISTKIMELITSQGLESSLYVYSEGKIEDFQELERLNPNFLLHINPFTTFHNLVCADVLVMSKSTFSYAAALLSKGIVFYESFRHMPQTGWIKIKENAKFDHKVFSEKLYKYNQSVKRA